MAIALYHGHQANWLEAQIAREVDFGRFPLLLPGLAVAGVFVWIEAPSEPPLAALGIAVATLLALRFLTGRHAATAWLAPVALALAALAAGGLAIGFQSAFFGTPMLERSTTAHLEGVVVAAERDGTAQRVVLRLTGHDLAAPAPRKVRLTLRPEIPHEVGETIRLTGRLFPVRGPVVPGGYDPARRLYFDGIGATGFAYGAAETVAPPKLGVRTVVERVRRAVAARIAATEAPEKGFAVALLVGDRGLMDEADVEALRVSGLGHILAISGLHMALFAGSVFAVVRLALALVPRLALRYPIKKWAAVAGLVAATFYLALSGASVATVRAYIMLVVTLVAVLADRPALTMRSVALAASALIALDPASVVEPGFQMSFLAVIALVGAYEWWAGRPSELRRAGPRTVTFLIGLAATSLIAGLATAPVSAYHFERLAPLGFLANLAAMPIFTFLAMPAGIVTLAAMPFGLEAAPLHVMGGALDVILTIAHKVADWTGTDGLVGRVPAAATLLAVAGIVFLSVMTAPWRLLGLIAVAAGIALGASAERPTLFVADDGESVAVRGPTGSLALAPGTSEYAGASFLAADGDPHTPKDAKAGRCDALGCTLVAQDGGPVALPASPRSALEDCRRAAVVVSRSAIGRCGAALVIDPAQLREGGSRLVWRERTGWRVLAARRFGPSRRWQTKAEMSYD